MEALYSWKGSNHPHQSQASSIHVDVGKVVEQLPSKVVHACSTIPLEHQVQEG